MSGGGGAGAGRYGAYNEGYDATPNTGSGGGGSTGPSQYHNPSSGGQGGGDGGSGVVILRYPSGYSATYTGGVTMTSSVVGSDKVDIITATSNNSQTVTFSE